MRKDQNLIETEKTVFPETPPHPHQALDRKPQTSSWSKGIMGLMVASLPILVAATIATAAYFCNLVLKHESMLAAIDAKLNFIIEAIQRKP